MQFSGHMSIQNPEQDLSSIQRDLLFDQSKSEQYRRYVTSLACSLLSIIFFLFVAVLNFAENHYTIAGILLGCIFFCILSVLLQLATSQSSLPAWILVSTHISLSFYLILHGGHNIGSLIWTFVYPHAFMLWLGLRRGTTISLLFLCALLVLVFSPLRSLISPVYPNEALIRYIIVLSGLFALAFFSEYMRDRMQKKLIFLNLQMKNTALTDPLTGLGNRLAFEQHLKMEYARFLRQGDEFCLIMGDIDHFKNINDRKGHAVGDAVLQHTAELLSSIIRKQDAVFRWGGEEFVVTLSGIPHSDLMMLAENLRSAIAETPCPYQNDKIYYTMSFGAYSCNPLEGATAAMDKTDRLLYAAKRAGRNRVMSNDTPF